MNRRGVIKGMGAIALYASFPTIVSEFLTACQSGQSKFSAVFFNKDEMDWIHHIVDALLPSTNTPGGLDTQVPFFIDMVVKNCMTGDDQQHIRNGLRELNKKNNAHSLSVTGWQDVVKKIDEDSFVENSQQSWFRIVKKLALIGHFTSQRGMNEALNYVKVPGDYKACIPYKAGEKGLAKTFLMYW